jgi:hypothetical protein
MRISVRQLRRVIKEAVEGEMGMPGNMPANEGGIIEISVPSYFMNDPNPVHDIAFKTCPDLFSGYNSATGKVKLYDPAGDAELARDLADFIIEIYDPKYEPVTPEARTSLY